MKNKSLIEVPDSYNNIQETLKAADKILSDAVDNSSTLFHTLVVSLFDGKKVSSRVMVLREFDLKKRVMRFHTDYRASKIQQLSDNPSVSVIGYDPELKVQIKLGGKIDIHYDDDVTQKAWEGSSNRSKKCYTVKGGSSKKINDPVEYDIQEFDPESGYKNFAVLLFSFRSLEYLYLKRSGHRRAIHTWGSALDSNWLVP